MSILSILQHLMGLIRQMRDFKNTSTLRSVRPHHWDVHWGLIALMPGRLRMPVNEAIDAYEIFRRMS